MKHLRTTLIILITFLSFTSMKNEVKVIDDPQIIDSILKTEQVVINRITCKLKDGNLCPLEINKDEISVDCSCEDAKMVLEPKIKLLGEWDQKESETVVKYAHEYLKSSAFTISEIVFLKSKEQHYLFVRLSEKLMNNRILFTIEK